MVRLMHPSSFNATRLLEVLEQVDCFFSHILQNTLLEDYCHQATSKSSLSLLPRAIDSMTSNRNYPLPPACEVPREQTDPGLPMEELVDRSSSVKRG